MKIDKKYLPSKKFVTAVSIAAVLVLIAVALGSIKFSGTKNTNLSTINASSSPSEIDSDNDGLPDWEEALYNTDPHNIDTDGDGTPDGEEITEGRDPLKANTAAYGQTPNDKISTALIAQDQEISSVDQNISATQKMAQDLMSNIFASQPVNGTMDQNTQDTLTQQALNDIPQKQFTGSTTIADLNIVNATDEKTFIKDLLVYATAYYAQINTLRKTLGQDLIIIDENISSGNTTENNTQMLKIISVYQTIINNLIKMPIPAISNSLAIQYHLRIINDVEILVDIDNDIMNASSNNDGAVIYSDLTLYNDTLADLKTALGVVDIIFNVQTQ